MMSMKFFKLILYFSILCGNFFFTNYRCNDVCFIEDRCEKINRAWCFCFTALGYMTPFIFFFYGLKNYAEIFFGEKLNRKLFEEIEGIKKKVEVLEIKFGVLTR